MASSGMEFITSLNSSMASSASTYAKSKAGQRDEIQKELNKTDRQILSLQRLLRSPSSRSSSKVALGSLTQLYQSQVKEGRSLRDDIERERDAVEVALDKLENENNALHASAEEVLLKMNETINNKSFKNVQTGKASVFVKGLTIQLRTLDDASRVIAYAKIAEKVAASDADEKEAILAEIEKATATHLKSTDAAASINLGDRVNPNKWWAEHKPLITENIKDKIRESPELQKHFLKKSITTTKPNDAFVEELRGLIRGEVLGGGVSGSASAAAAIQVAEVDAPLADKQASLDRIAGGVLVVDEAGEIAIKPGADEQQTANAQKVLAAIPGGTYQGFSEEVRRMKDQPARTGSYLESLKSELATLKARRNAQVSALSKSPRLSTGKMALLDHPILRVAGFREAPPMRLLKWAGRPEQPAVAAAEPAAPVAAAGDEGPEVGVKPSGVYVIPGIVNKLKSQWEALRDSDPGKPEEEAALTRLKNSINDIEYFPDYVKTALGQSYVDLKSVVSADMKGGYNSEYAPEFQRSIDALSKIEPSLAEYVGTVSNVVEKAMKDRKTGLVDAGRSDRVNNMAALFSFLDDRSVLGEGATVEPGIDINGMETSGALGAHGDAFVLNYNDEDVVDPVIQSLGVDENIAQHRFNADPRYGTYDFTFEGRPGIAGPPAEKAPTAPKDPGKATEEYLNEDQKMQHDAMTGVNVPLDVAYRDEAFDDEQSAATGEDISAVKEGHPNPWTQQTRPPFPEEPPTWSETPAAAPPAAPPPPAAEPELTPEEEEAAMVEAIDLGKGSGTRVTPPVTARVSPAGVVYDSVTGEEVSPPPAAEAEDPTRKEFADLIAQPSLTNEQFGRAADLVGASPEDEQQALSEELKAKHPRGAPVEPPAATDVDETLTEAFRQPAPPAPPTTPGILPKDHPDFDPRFVGGSKEYEDHANKKLTEESNRRYEASKRKKYVFPEQELKPSGMSMIDSEDEPAPGQLSLAELKDLPPGNYSKSAAGDIIDSITGEPVTVGGRVSKAADDLLTSATAVGSEVVTAGEEMASDILGWAGSFFDEPVPEAEAVPPKPKEPSAADVTFKPESSDIKLDFAEMELPRKQVEATKIILKKFKAAGLSDNMAKAAIINGLAESQLDTFASLQEGKKDNSYGIWQFNDVPGALGYGIPHENLTDPYWMTDHMIEVIKATTQKPYGDDAIGLSRWITTNIENPKDAKDKAVNRPKRYGKEADKIIKEARAELALETTPEV